HSDPVLARHAAAAGDALLEDLVAGLEHALDLGSVALVEEQDRVNVAVARVKYIDDPHAVFLADLGDASQHVRQLRARDDAVLGAVTWAEPANRAEGLLAAFPQQQPLLCIARLAHLPRSTA